MKPQSRILIKQSIQNELTPQYSSYQLFNINHHLDFKSTVLKTVRLIHLNKGQKYNHSVQETSTICVCPIFGITTIVENQEDVKLASGETFLNDYQDGENIQIQNPSMVNRVSFFLITMEKQISEQSVYSWINGAKTETAVSLLPKSKNYHFRILKMSGREEVQMPIHSTKYNYFYNPNSAFEINGCLLNPGDGLILRNCKQLDCEALANEAVLFWFSFT